MIHPVNIGGQVVGIGWTQEVVKRYTFRASSIGGPPSIAKLTNPKTATAAITTLLWLLLPPAQHAAYPSPEDLFVAIDHEKDGVEIHNALAAVIGEMNPPPEKKRTGKTRRSRK